MVTAQGLKADRRKLDAICNFPIPTEGMAIVCEPSLLTYPSFWRIASPLYAITCFKWNSSCQESFDSLKGMLTNAQVLGFLPFDLGFTVETDASGKV